MRDSTITCEKCGMRDIDERKLSGHRRSIRCDVEAEQRRAKRAGLVPVHDSTVGREGVPLTMVRGFTRRGRGGATPKNVEQQYWAPAWVATMISAASAADYTSRGRKDYAEAYPALAHLTRGIASYERERVILKELLRRGLASPEWAGVFSEAVQGVAHLSTSGECVPRMVEGVVSDLLEEFTGGFKLAITDCIGSACALRATAETQLGLFA